MPRIDISTADEEKIIQLINRKMDELRSTIELRRKGGFEAAAALVRSGEGQQNMEKLRSEFARLQAKKMAGLQADERLSEEATRTRTLVFIATGVLNILFLLWAYQRIAESIKLRDEALGQAQRRGAELQQQKDLLKVTLASIGDCVLVTDKEGRVDFMNKVAEQVTGWSLDEAHGRPHRREFSKF